MAFEARIVRLWEEGELPSLLHICGGNESQLIEIFQNIREQDWVFTSHRAHYHNLLKGVSEDELEQKIRNDLSMFCYDKQKRIYQSAILSGCVPIAVGVAAAIREEGSDEHVHCFIGDGAADNGALWEAALYVTGHSLPCTFYIENNRRQVDTGIVTRRGRYHELCRMVAPCVREYWYDATWPHAGSGCAHQITFNRTTPL